MERPSGLSDETAATMDDVAPAPRITWHADDAYARLLEEPRTLWEMTICNTTLRHVDGSAVGGIISALRFVNDPPPRTPQEEMRVFLEQWWESGRAAREDHWHAQWAAGDWLDERLPWERWSTGLGNSPD